MVCVVYLLHCLVLDCCWPVDVVVAVIENRFCVSKLKEKKKDRHVVIFAAAADAIIESTSCGDRKTSKQYKLSPKKAKTTTTTPK